MLFDIGTSVSIAQDCTIVGNLLLGLRTAPTFFLALQRDSATSLRRTDGFSFLDDGCDCLPVQLLKLCPS